MSDSAPGRPAAGAFLKTCWQAAVAAVDAGRAVERAISQEGERLNIAGRPLEPDETLCVVAAGKAAVPMAAAVEAIAGERIRRGVVVTRAGQGGALERLPVREASHPVPDARCEAAAREVLSLAGAPRDEKERLLLLLSGGASSLLTCPLPGLSLRDVCQATEVLLGCGADISELNCVRKHVGAATGGRLAEAWSGPIEVLAVSDVPGDDIEVIGSGPCAGDPTTYRDALEVLDRYGVGDRIPASVRAHLARGVEGEEPESLFPGAPALARVRTTLVARNEDARRAAVAAGSEAGWASRDLGEVLRGEARTCGRQLARWARDTHSDVEGDQPTLWVAGGETTVTLQGAGRGGRSQELALAAALEWSNEDVGEGLALLAAGTDGHDGPTDAAGAFADPGSVLRGARSGADALSALAENDAYTFFDAEGGLLRSGATGTNVMDLVLISRYP